MNKKRYTYLFSVIAILFFLLSYLNSLKDYQKGDRDFALSKNTEVKTIKILPQDGEKIVLNIDEQGKWWIDNDYYANEFAARDLIRTIKHIAVRQPVSLNHKEKVNKQLENDGVLVKIYVDDYIFNFFELFKFFKTQRQYSSFIVGNNATDVVGTYMRMSNSENPYIVYLPGYSDGIAEVFSPEKHIWFDPVVVDLNHSQIKWVKIINNEKAEESYILKMDDDLGFEFYDINNNLISSNFRVDTNKVFRFISSFNNLYYETLLIDEKLSESESLIFPDYAFRVTVADWHQNKYSFNVFRKYSDGQREPRNIYDPDRFYIELDNNHRAIAQYYVFGRILRPLSFFEIN